MSRENVEIVREVYEAPQMIDARCISPDAEFDFTALYPDQPVLRGFSEMRNFRDEGPWGKTIQFEPERFFDVDDERVLVAVRVTSTGRASGTPIEARVAHEFTLRDGLVRRVKLHRSEAEALKAVGLEK